MHAQALIDLLTAKSVWGNREKGKSLHELVQAIMWASGPIKHVASSGEESDMVRILSLSACMQRLAMLAAKTCKR